MKNNWKIYNQKLLVDKLLDEFDELVWIDERVRRGKGKNKYRFPLGYLIHFARRYIVVITNIRAGKNIHLYHIKHYRTGSVEIIIKQQIYY